MDNISIDNTVAVVCSVAGAVTENVVKFVVGIGVQKVGGFQINDIKPACCVASQCEINNISRTVPQHLRCPDSRHISCVADKVRHGSHVNECFIIPVHKVLGTPDDERLRVVAVSSAAVGEVKVGGKNVVIIVLFIVPDVRVADVTDTLGRNDDRLVVAKRGIVVAVFGNSEVNGLAFFACAGEVSKQIFVF